MTGLKFGLPAVMAFALIRQPIRYALALGVLLLAGELDPARHGTTLHRERNDFGLLRVTRSRDGQFLDLIHGNTLHGRQRTDERSTPRPMTYYHPRGPIGRVFATLPRERVHRVGIVGLGIGSVAAYAEPGQRWTFFEIDPAVARIARNQQYFTFLASCRAEWNIVLGDARRALTTTDDAFDLLVIDAFSSDAIPIHLLTREALRLYVARLTSRGVLVLHVSNVHLDLPPLVARLAADHEPPLSLRYSPDVATDAERADGKTDSQWLILARRDDDLQPILTHRPMGTSIPMVWERVPLVPGPVWRDDFANVLGVWRHREPE